MVKAKLMTGMQYWSRGCPDAVLGRTYPDRGTPCFPAIAPRMKNLLEERLRRFSLLPDMVNKGIREIRACHGAQGSYRRMQPYALVPCETRITGLSAR